jgi:hypothetical protein
MTSLFFTLGLDMLNFKGIAKLPTDIQSSRKGFLHLSIDIAEVPCAKRASPAYAYTHSKAGAHPCVQKPAPSKVV